MRILLSNDDGVFAEGINTLFKELSQNHQVIMVAPEKERSGCGHGLTIGEPIRARKIEENIYSCSGTPADCILFAIDIVYKKVKPDLVISGINHGANLGQDRFYSGTMAAAREGVFRGIPSIAVSLVTASRDSHEYFDVASRYISTLVNRNIQKNIPEMHLLNINIPNLPQEKIVQSTLTTPGYQIYTEEVVERVDHRGKAYYWLGGSYEGHKDIPGSDCNAVFEKKISVTLEDLTGASEVDKKLIESLQEKVGI